MRDNGTKNNYPSGTGITFTSGKVDKALSQLSVLKATGWDFIPGEVYASIMEEKITNPVWYWKICRDMARLLTTLINSKEEFLKNCSSHDL